MLIELTKIHDRTKLLFVLLQDVYQGDQLPLRSKFILRARKQPAVLNPSLQLLFIFILEPLRGGIFWELVFLRYWRQVAGPFPWYGPYTLALVILGVKVELVKGDCSTDRCSMQRKSHSPVPVMAIPASCVIVSSPSSWSYPISFLSTTRVRTASRQYARST